MQAVLISIQPGWCELIASGKKKIEIRKGEPKQLKPPFKAFIYCTNGKEKLWVLRETERAFTSEKIAFICAAKDVGGTYQANGKVIGEFVCGRIDTIGKRGINNNFDYCYQSLNVFGNDDIEVEITAIQKSCIPKVDLNAYGATSMRLFAWHISDLKIYDEPRELGEFLCKCNKKYCTGCEDFCDEGETSFRVCGGLKVVTKPPQSWMYVEVEG